MLYISISRTPWHKIYNLILTRYIFILCISKGLIVTRSNMSNFWKLFLHAFFPGRSKKRKQEKNRNKFHWVQNCSTHTHTRISHSTELKKFRFILFASGASSILKQVKNHKKRKKLESLKRNSKLLPMVWMKCTSGIMVFTLLSNQIYQLHADIYIFLHSSHCLALNLN